MSVVTDDHRSDLTDGAAHHFLIPDELWQKIEPLLPVRKNTHPFGGGRPRVSDRACMDAIFFVLRSGCQWKALAATGICAPSTAHDRFQEWVRDGLFRRLWRAGLAEYDRLKGIDWAWLSMDGAMSKAPLGGEKIGTQSRRPRQTRGQTLAADRGRRRAGRPGRRRGQPPRHAAGPAHDRGRRRRPARADQA
jgi:transposase